MPKQKPRTKKPTKRKANSSKKARTLHEKTKKSATNKKKAPPKRPRNRKELLEMTEPSPAVQAVEKIMDSEPTIEIHKGGTGLPVDEEGVTAADVTHTIKPPKPKKTKNPLLAALEFVKPALLKDGPPEHTFVRMHGGAVVAFDRTIACGHPIPQTELSICAHGKTLLDAVKHFGEGDTITQPAVGNLQLTIGNMVAQIESKAFASFTRVDPDPLGGAAFDTIRDGFKALDKVIKKSGESVVESSLLLKHSTMFACDREMFIEYWHGCDMPEVILPKQFISAVAKTKGKIVGAGLGQHTFTLYFENGAWIRTQCYTETWPAVDNIFPPAPPPGTFAVPDDLFEIVKTQAPFGDDRVYLSENHIGSGPQLQEGVYSFVVNFPAKVPAPVPLNGKKMCLLKGHVTKMIVDLERPALFYGEKMRAAIYPVQCSSTPKN